MPAEESRVRVVGHIDYLKANGLYLMAVVKPDDQDYTVTFRVPPEQHNDVVTAYHFNHKVALGFTTGHTLTCISRSGSRVFIKDLTLVIEV